MNKTRRNKARKRREMAKFNRKQHEFIRRLKALAELIQKQHESRFGKPMEFTVYV